MSYLLERGSAEESLGLRRYVDVAWRRKAIVLAVVAAAITAAAVASLAAEPTYRASTKLVVGQGNTLFSTNQANAFQPFTATMSELVKSDIVANQVIEQLRLSESARALLGQISVSTNPDTAVLKISVTDHDPKRAERIAASVGDVFESLVSSRLGREPISGTTSETEAPLTVRVFDPAHVDPSPVSPKPARNVALAGSLGLILGLIAAFMREHFDRRLRDREAIERAFGVPVIGEIPFNKHLAKGDSSVASWHEAGEAFSTLRANLQYLGVERVLRSILVTSGTAGEGKTSVSANLAMAIARSGASAVVIEGDLRRPRLRGALGVAPGGPGLTNVLVGKATLKEALVNVPFDRDTKWQPGERDGKVALLASGPLPPNPPELLASDAMRRVLERLSAAYDYLLIDSPPFLPVADALELARMVDGVILVVGRNSATTDEASQVRSIADRLGISLLGAVITRAAISPSSYYYESDDGHDDLTGPQNVKRVPRARASKPKAAASAKQ